MFLQKVKNVYYIWNILYMEMDTLTETGLLTLAGIIVAFLLRCCQQIEQSRCSKINCWGIKCDREVLSEEYLEKYKKEIEEKKKVGEKKADENI